MDELENLISELLQNMVASKPISTKTERQMKHNNNSYSNNYNKIILTKVVSIGKNFKKNYLYIMYLMYISEKWPKCIFQRNKSSKDIIRLSFVVNRD